MPLTESLQDLPGKWKALFRSPMRCQYVFHHLSLPSLLIHTNKWDKYSYISSMTNIFASNSFLQDKFKQSLSSYRCKNDFIFVKTNIENVSYLLHTFYFEFTKYHFIKKLAKNKQKVCCLLFLKTSKQRECNFLFFDLTCVEIRSR